MLNIEKKKYMKVQWLVSDDCIYNNLATNTLQYYNIDDIVWT